MANLQITKDNKLTFANAEASRKQLVEFFKRNRDESIFCDLSHISHCDSAGLALLIETMRFARQHKKVCKLSGMNQNILSMAEFCGVKSILLA